MSARLTLALALLPWLATAAQPGAWPREKGEGVIAASGTVEKPAITGRASACSPSTV